MLGADGMTGWMADGTEEWGGRPVARTIAAAGSRRRAALTGTVRAVGVRRRPRRAGPWPGERRCTALTVATEAELDDGTGTIVLRWVGRDGVPGIVVGASLAVEGTVLADRGRRVLLNPLYRFGYSSNSW
ncbi:MAG TPA: hypothetical protein VHX40_07315 [Acidimicrobiales bacterium]|nr:hypothetical protein [Acidimicrobiales bacterium]